MKKLKKILNKNLNILAARLGQPAFAELNNIIKEWMRKTYTIKVGFRFKEIISTQVDFQGRVGVFYDNTFSFSRTVKINSPSQPTGPYCKTIYSFPNIDSGVNLYEYETEPIQLEASEGLTFLLGTGKSKKIQFIKSLTLNQDSKTIEEISYITLVNPTISGFELDGDDGFILSSDMDFPENQISGENLEELIISLKEKIEEAKESLPIESEIENIRNFLKKNSLDPNSYITITTSTNNSAVSNSITSKINVEEFLIQLWDRTVYDPIQTGLGFGGTGSGLNCTAGINALEEDIWNALTTELRNKPCNTITESFVVERWKQLAEEIIKTPKFMDWTDCN